MMPSAKPSHAAIQSAIRAAGGRVTPARVRVIDFLKKARQPVSHGEIEEALSLEPLPAIDRVTLYRVLDWLADAGLAHKAADGRGVFRFSVAQPDAQHAKHIHFRCTGCGGVFCLKAPVPKPPHLPRGFRLSGMEFDLRGQCRTCTQKRS
jgi:Fur family ferric uptake transcriptional regulator